MCASGDNGQNVDGKIANATTGIRSDKANVLVTGIVNISNVSKRIMKKKQRCVKRAINAQRKPRRINGILKHYYSVIVQIRYHMLTIVAGYIVISGYFKLILLCCSRKLVVYLPQMKYDLQVVT